MKIINYQYVSIKNYKPYANRLSYNLIYQVFTSANNLDYKIGFCVFNKVHYFYNESLKNIPRLNCNKVNKFIS